MQKILNLTTVAFFVLAIGIVTSVSLIGVHQILLVIPAFYFLFKAYQDNKISISKSNIFLFLFLIWCTISLVFNFNELIKPSKSFGKLKFIFFALSTLPVLFYWISNVKPAFLKIVIHTFFASIIAAGLIALYQFISSNGGRSEGLIGIMRYGYASAMIAVFLLGVILQRKKLNFDFNVTFAVVAVVFSILGMFLTQTRGALAGFLSAMPFVLYFYRPKVGIAFGIFSAILISIIAYFYLFGSNTTGEGSRYLKSRNELGDVVRREQWQSAIIATKEHPVFGWGYNNFYSQVERIKKENNLKTTFYINEHSHNTFLEVAAGTGLVGATFFLLWLITWAIECFKLELRGIFIPFGVSMIASGQFEVILDTNNSVLLFFVYSLSQYALNIQKQKAIV